MWSSMGCSPGAPRLEGPHHLKIYVFIDIRNEGLQIILAQGPLTAYIRPCIHIYIHTYIRRYGRLVILKFVIMILSTVRIIV